MKTISQFYRLNQVKLCVLGDLDGGLALMITQAIPLVKQCRGYILYPLYNYDYVIMHILAANAKFI